MIEISWEKHKKSQFSDTKDDIYKDILQSPIPDASPDFGVAEDVSDEDVGGREQGGDGVGDGQLRPILVHFAQTR